MTHRQHRLGSGFTAASTVKEVIAGIDLTGKNAIVTGGHSGLGLEVTKALAGSGASVTVGSRDPARAALAVDGIGKVTIGQLDLLDPASVEAFASRWTDTGRPLHLLVNNAGYPAPAEIVRDERGYEAQFAVNHLGHFQLTLALHPALRAANGARVVTTTSGAQRLSDILWDDPVFSGGGYEPGLAYAQSKTANVLFTVELDRRWAADGIRAYAPHPGVVAGTAFNSAVGVEQQRAMGLVDESGEPIIDPERGKKTVEQGAATLVFAATSPLLDEVGGVYLNNSDVSELNDDQPPVSAEMVSGDVVSHSIDPASARRLWELSERLLRG